MIINFVFVDDFSKGEERKGSFLLNDRSRYQGGEKGSEREGR